MDGPCRDGTGKEVDEQNKKERSTEGGTEDKTHPGSLTDRDTRTTQVEDKGTMANGDSPTLSAENRANEENKEGGDNQNQEELEEKEEECSVSSGYPFSEESARSADSILSYGSANAESANVDQSDTASKHGTNTVTGQENNSAEASIVNNKSTGALDNTNSTAGTTDSTVRTDGQATSLIQTEPIDGGNKDVNGDGVNTSQTVADRAGVTTAGVTLHEDDALTDSDPLSLNNIQPFNASLPETSRPHGYIYPSQPEVFEQIMMDTEDIQNLDIPTDLMKNRDVDSLVAAQLMTSLARGDLVFDQQSTVQGYPSNNDQSVYMNNVPGPQGQNGVFPLPDQNNNLYGGHYNYGQGAPGGSMLQNQIPNYDLDQMNPYYQGQEGGHGCGLDLRRHSYPGGDIGHGLGYPPTHGGMPQPHHARSRSEPSGNLEGIHTAFGHLIGQPQVHGLPVPQPGYPNGNPDMQPYHHDPGYFNEPFMPLQSPNGSQMPQAPHMKDMEHCMLSSGQQTTSSTSSEVSFDSDDSDNFTAAGTYEFRADRSAATKRTLPGSIQLESLHTTKRRKRSKYSRTSFTGNQAYSNVMDKFYFSNSMGTKESGRKSTKRIKRSNSLPQNLFSFLSPDINPKDVDSIDHKSLISKYIDYLLIENEQITEMSKSVSVHIENCVMDDPYLMDIIKVKIPFPTPKYLQWLQVYYPTIHVDWDAVNQELSTYIPDANGQKKRTYYLDNRPSPVLLGESFYFFQREKDRMMATSIQ